MRVFLGPEQATAAPVEPEQVSTVQIPTDVPPRATEQVSAGLEALTSWSAVVLAPIMAELSVSRETIRAQAETIGRQSERVAGLETEVGRLSAELRGDRQSESSLVGFTAPQPTPAPREPALLRWRLLWPLWASWMAVAFVIALVVVLVVRW